MDTGIGYRLILDEGGSSPGVYVTNVPPEILNDRASLRWCWARRRRTETVGGGELHLVHHWAWTSPYMAKWLPMNPAEAAADRIKTTLHLLDGVAVDTHQKNAFIANLAAVEVSQRERARLRRSSSTPTASALRDFEELGAETAPVIHQFVGFALQLRAHRG